MQSKRCGLVVIAGRPNVGKSTLLNRMIGEKISITADKPQTTRHRILGIKTAKNNQIVFVDTPGLHLGAKKALNRQINKTALTALKDVDVIILVIDALRWDDNDDFAIERIKHINTPTLAVINKVDRLKDKAMALPLIEKLDSMGIFEAIVPVSALRKLNLDTLETEIISRLPEAEFIFAPDQLTDRSARFLAAEIIREKLTRQLGQELPYALAVEIERFKESKGITNISAVIWVERAGQKKIVIGSGGKVLKTIGTQARKELERMLSVKVHLQLWTRLRKGWSDSDKALRSYGYIE